MFSKDKLNLKNYFPVFIFFFGLLFNQFSGNRGVFPIDSFSHFDIGYRILNGDLPFRDYWTVSGPFVDYLQAFLFSIFDVNWQTYLLNASILNGLVAVLTYKLLLSFKLNKIFSFFYVICFSILAYPVSGTPFVDLHSTYFSIISIYIFVFAIKTEKLKFWFLLPFFLFFAFLSKQVPAVYIGFSIILLVAYNFILNNKKKNFNIFFTLAASTTIFLLIFLAFFYFKNINFQNFLDQYINHPREIGKSRYSNIDYNLKNTILDFKFIHLIFGLFLITNIKQFLKKKNFYKEKDFQVFLIFIFLFFSLIQHQIITKNQVFIFFLIPLFCALVHTQIQRVNFKHEKYLIYFLVLMCLFATGKYHIRFNLEKKFHELNNVNFSNTVHGDLLDKRLKGLNWITPGKKSQKEVADEIKKLSEISKILKEDTKKKMLFTNYSFFSVLLGESTNTVTRWFPGDDSAFPRKKNTLYDSYKNFIFNQIENKKIANIYIISDVSEKNLLEYLSSECLKRVRVHKDLLKFKINYKCKDLNRN